MSKHFDGGRDGHDEHCEATSSEAFPGYGPCQCERRSPEHFDGPPPCHCTYVADMNDRDVLVPESYEACPRHGVPLDGVTEANDGG